MIRRRLMMLKKSSGGLPEGYTAVDYIQTSGSQRIDTGVKSSASVGLSADFCFVDARSNQNLAQTYSDSEHYLLMVLMISSWGSPDGAAWFVCGYNAVQYFKKADTDMYIISMRMGNTRSRWTAYSIKKPTRRKQHFRRMREICGFLCVIRHMSMDMPI